MVAVVMFEYNGDVEWRGLEFAWKRNEKNGILRILECAKKKLVTLSICLDKVGHVENRSNPIQTLNII